MRRCNPWKLQLKRPTLPLTDSEEQNAGKRISWANIKAMLGKLYVPMTRRINNRALSADVTLTGDDIKTSATDETSISAALSNKAEIIEPTWYKLPTQNGYNADNDEDGAVYGKAGINIVMIFGLIATPAETVGDTLIAQLPEGFCPKKQPWMLAFNRTTHLSYALRITPSGAIYSWGTSLPSDSIMEIPMQGFYS